MRILDLSKFENPEFKQTNNSFGIVLESRPLIVQFYLYSFCDKKFLMKKVEVVSHD